MKIEINAIIIPKIKDARSPNSVSKKGILSRNVHTLLKTKIEAKSSRNSQTTTLSILIIVPLKRNAPISNINSLPQFYKKTTEGDRKTHHRIS